MAADKTDSLAIWVIFFKGYVHDLTLTSVVLRERSSHLWILEIEAFIKLDPNFFPEFALLAEPNVIYFVLIPLEMSHDRNDIVRIVQTKKIISCFQLLWDQLLDIFKRHDFMRLNYEFFIKIILF